MPDATPAPPPGQSESCPASASREWEVLFDAVAVGMVVLDQRGAIRRCNARALALAGVSTAEELLGRCFWQAILHVERQPEDDVVARAMADGAPRRATIGGRAPGRVFDVTAAPHPDGGAVLTFDDVTPYHVLAERHRMVIETASDAIVITDPERRVALANPAASALFGIPAADIVGMPAAALAGEPQRYETLIVRADGDRRIAAVSSAPLREVGEVTGVVASLRDVTDERRARDAVMQSEARYRNLFETATDAIYTLDARGDFTSVNRAACEILGHGREELLGRSMIPFVDPDDIEEAREHFRAARAGQPTHYFCHFFRAAGERRLASVTNTPIYHGSEVVGVLGIARDVTDERARDEALRRSEQRYARLVELAWDAIFTIDEEGRFTSANHALERAVGFTREQLRGQPAVSMVPPETREEMSRTVRAALGGERQRTELRYSHVDGTLRTGSLTITPIVEDGRVVGGLGIVRDVTDERRLTEQLLQREKLAAVGQLVSGVAHELNNPLAGIMAFSQLLLASSPSSPDQLDALATINKEAKRAAKIISNLLLFARQRPPERMPTDVNRVMLDALELRRYSLHTQQIEIVTELDETLPAIHADPFQLQQVFLNLLTNAEQALRAHGGRRRIVLRTRREGARIVAMVADTGPGIPSELLDRIFNPFYTTKPVGEGTGLGLSISDGIVREHGGQIRVESRPGAGAAFLVELPLSSPGAPHGAAPDAPQPHVPRGTA